MESRKSNILFEATNKQHQIKQQLQQPQQLHQQQQRFSRLCSVRKTIFDKLPDLQENDLAILTLDKPAFQQHQNHQQQQHQNHQQQQHQNHQQQQQQQHQNHQQQQHQNQQQHQQQHHNQQHLQIHNQDQKKRERLSSIIPSKIPTLQKMSVLHELDVPIADTVRQRFSSLCPSKIPILKKISTVHEIDHSMLEVLSTSTLEEKTIRKKKKEFEKEQRCSIKSNSLTPRNSCVPHSTPLPHILKESESLTKTTNTSTFQESMAESNKQKQHFDASKSVIMKNIANETDAIEKGMEKCIKLVEDNSSTALKVIRKYISSVRQNDVIKRNMAMWKDEYNLNLIHYAIIYSRPEILKYLLADSQIFPPESQPIICPYAHLAAYLGATNCIKIILTQRPDDFFESRLPEHDIKLPSHLVARFGLHKLNKTRVTNSGDDVLRRIKHFKLECGESSQCLIDNQSDNIHDLINHLQGVCFSESKRQISKLSLPQISKFRKPVSYDNLYTDKTDKTKLPEVTNYFMGKTPLTLAVDKSHAETMTALLAMTVHKQPKLDGWTYKSFDLTCGPLTMATRAMSPAAIVAMYKAAEIKINDYKEAVLVAIKELLPDCLIALLSNKTNRFENGFGGVNKYHILYSQCVDADESKYRMLPQMTQALIHCNEDVNKYNAAKTFPLYSLITISFKVGSTRMLYHTFECLQLLLEAGANPFFSERKKTKLAKPGAYTDLLLRGTYTSAFNCIFENAKSPDLTINRDLALAVMNNSILYVLIRSNTERDFKTEVILYQYMQAAFHVGLDTQVISKLYEYGADPTIPVDNRFSVNAYFDELFAFFREFPRTKTDDHYKKEMHKLVFLCEHMWSTDLKKAVKIILRQYVHNIPLEAVAITRYFLYLADDLMRNRRKIRPKHSCIKSLYVGQELSTSCSSSSSASSL